MSLRKFIAIKNVGRFHNYGASGDVTLKRYNLIFAENGRGKTTLCAVLRSLQSGDAAHIVGRRTLGSPDAPEISVLTDTGTASFSGGIWSALVPALAIFDSTFVTENVYSGDLVDLDHKRNLYRVIIGRDGVNLAHAVDEIDADIRTKTSEIRDRRAYVQSYAPRGMSVEDFVPLAADPDIDAKISAKQMELEAVRQAGQLRARAALTPVTLPVMPNDLEAALAATVEGLAADAGRRVADQVAAHAMHARGETWLSEGLKYVRDHKCPFCSQSLESSTLLEAYTAYFSSAYNTLRQQISALGTNVERTFGDRIIAETERILDSNLSAVEFWARYCEIAQPAFSASASVGEALRMLRQSVQRLLERKTAAPLDRVAFDKSYIDAANVVESLRQGAVAYNNEVEAVNTTIIAKKATTGTTDALAVETALRALQAIKARHEPATAAACQAYETAIKEKVTKETAKAAARAKLDEYTEQIIGRYENSINTLLDDFQAGFRITETKHSYPGGVPSSSFQILINETPVELGDASTPLDKPSFRNTLSSGDKNTLALAFFLAQLEHDRDKSSRIVVFDDPFNSQDAFRKDHTVEKIRKCGEGCVQVMVLSHDHGFLKRVWDRLATQTADRKCLQLIRIGLRNTAISEWDIEKATQQRFKAELKSLADYYTAGEGDPRDVVSKIRPVLETYCRNLYPSQFPEADMLAAIIAKIRLGGPDPWACSGRR